MFPVLRLRLWRAAVPVHRALGRSARAAAGTPPLPQAAAGRPFSRQQRRPERGCTVDPQLEEQFVFMDLTDAEQVPAEEQIPPQIAPPPLPPPPPPPQQQQQVPPQKQLRSLERQLDALKAVTPREAEPDTNIQFQDADFPLDPSLVASKRKKKAEKRVHKIFGSPDAEEPLSDVGCSGCGALLHCSAAAVPGYLPSEKFKALKAEGRLEGATCQRCHLLTHHQRALELQMSKEEYRSVVRRIRSQKALVLLIVDVLDAPDSLVPDLPLLVGANKQVVVLGNKVDLLPADAPNYLRRIKRQLADYCHRAGFGQQVADVHLISAKTGFGVEALITALQRSWKYKGDVYLVGSANAGKSTLFNALLESDYCKSRASDVIHKATISPWPGTTLNLLKFPIINPTPFRMFRRRERLEEAARQTEDNLPPEELRRLQDLSKQGYVVGRVGRTFRAEGGAKRDVIDFDPDSLAFGDDQDGESSATAPSAPPPEELSYNELKDAHWLFDTPGIMKERDVLSLLKEQEVKSVVPTQAIAPRSFVLKPGTTLFLGALARIDFLQGEKSCWLSVVASANLPVHITSLEKADAVYQKHAGHQLLGIPQGGAERMKEFPPLVPQEVRLEGRGYHQATADIKLSSAGWVAVTAVEGDQLLFRVHGPEAAGFSVRSPPLLPHVVSLKGARIRKSAAYKVAKPAGRLEAGAADPLHANKKTTKKKKKKEQ